MENLLYPHKYLCKNIEDFKFNVNIIKKIVKFAKKGKLPNLIFHGDYGSGKSNAILYFLKNLLNSDKVYNRTSTILNVNDSNNEWPINIIKSPFYFELDAQDFGYNDKKILSAFVSQICKNMNVITNKYNIIIIKNAEKLTKDAQYTFRRIMENNFKSCRIIFSTHNTSLIDSSITSRCVMFRIPSPKNKELYDYLNYICDLEKIEFNSPDLKELVIKSERNINTGLFLLHVQYDNSDYENKDLPAEKFINAVNKCIKNYEFYNPLDVRKKLYFLLLHNIEINDFMDKSVLFILKNIETDFITKKKIIKAAMYYTKTLNMGYRSIFHLESYINYIILLLKGIDVDINFDNL